MLLPFLLTQHKVWKYCKMRIFTVSRKSSTEFFLHFKKNFCYLYLQLRTFSLQMKKYLTLYMYLIHK